MTYDTTDRFDNDLDDNFDDNVDESKAIEISLNNKQQDKNSTQVRQRIDELLERKRLKELLDDSDDW
ncbi:PA3496 family putative envelope integrity protein [Thalassotalea piscium]